MPEDVPTVAVVLVGLMGSGKTTVGKKVARLLDWRFVDCDVELEARSGRSVAEWFATDGEAAFRQAAGGRYDGVVAMPISWPNYWPKPVNIRRWWVLVVAWW